MSIHQRDIEHALQHGEFRPHFQPLVGLRTGRLHGFELLARWHHPRQGWIPPDQFIPLAEGDGWIDRLTVQLLHAGFSGMKGDSWKGFGWLDALHPDDLQPTWDAMRQSFADKKPIDTVYRVRPSETSPWKRLRSRGAARIRSDGEVICWYGCLEPLD